MFNSDINVLQELEGFDSTGLKVVAEGLLLLAECVNIIPKDMAGLQSCQSLSRNQSKHCGFQLLECFFLLAEVLVDFTQERVPLHLGP